MTGEVVAKLVQGAVMLLLAVIGGGIGWDQVKRHGAETEKRKQAERERDAANLRADHAKAPPASPSEVVGILRRLRARHDRMRGKAGRH